MTGGAARWREDVPQADGTVKRDVIAPKKGVTRQMAEKILADHLNSRINGEPREATIAARWLDAVGVELCDSCRHRMTAGIAAGK